MANKSYLGKGKIYLEQIGSSTGLIKVGNCSEYSLALNEDKKEQKDFEDAGGATVNTVSRIDSVTGNLTVLDVSAQNLAKALRGLVTTVATGSVVAEPHANAKFDTFIPTDKLADMTTMVVKNTGGVVTYIEGTDYTIGNSGIIPIAGGTLTDGQAVELTYTNRDAFDVETITAAGLEYKMVMDGLNEADSGKPVLITSHRVKINPAQALQLITEDFGTLPMTFDILKDSSIVGAGVSQFVKIQMVQ